MQTQYQIADSEMKFLEAKGIGIKELFNSMDNFNHCGGLLGLMYHIDEHGSMKSPIAQAMLNSLEPREQLKAFEYLDWNNEGEPDYSKHEEEDAPETVEYQEPEDEPKKKGWLQWAKSKK